MKWKSTAVVRSSLRVASHNPHRIRFREAKNESFELASDTPSMFGNINGTKGHPIRQFSLSSRGSLLI